MKHKIRFKIFVISALLLWQFACADAFLDIKSAASIQSPSSIEDFQALLDDARSTMNSSPPLTFAIIAGEEYWISGSDWHAVPITSNRIQEKNAYIWEKDVYQGESGTDWNNGYRKILYANIALEGVANFKPTIDQMDAWNNLKGSALFFRAWNFYLLAQQFCQVYDTSTAGNRLGLPLRLQSDVTVNYKRSSLEETYAQLVEDVTEAISLLPETSVVKTRPSKQAARLLLAKIYMDMERYEQALEMINAMGDLSKLLLDYNTLSTANSFPFTDDYGATNSEVLFINYEGMPTVMNRNRMNVNDDLLQLFEENDLRRELFYTEYTHGNTYYRGSYMGSTLFFLGLCTPEAVLIRAEINARFGNLEKVVTDLYSLDSKRYNQMSEIPNRTFQTKENAIRTVYNERRKELAFRGNRWSDLRRFNKEPAFSQEVIRYIDDQAITLVPGDDKFVWQIPQDVIRLSGIEQN